MRQGPGGFRALTTWESVWMPLGEGESVGLPVARGSGWRAQQVPKQESAREGRQSIWYRAGFNRPDHPGRVLLRFGGSFLATNVWFNGKLLGSHYGYFAPFGFDLSAYLRSDNLLVVCCESPIEKQPVGKSHVTGIFGEGDSRPYPSSAYFSLGEDVPWEMPVGLWRPVELEYVGAVHVDWMRLKPRLDAGDVGRLDIEARLRNLDAREMSGVIGFEVEGPGGAPVRLAREFRLPGGLEQTASVTLSIPDAKRWQPWRLGEPSLYQVTATVLVDDRLSTQVKDRFGFRDLDISPAHSGWRVRANGQPMFLRGANYTPAFHLDTLSEDVFRHDLLLAREANLDALRVHGHVLPPEFYALADEMGMLVFADFPLTGAYGYHASGDETRFFESAVREQVPEMVELLRNRPSVALYTAHDDPAWLPANTDLADVHVVRQNYTVDQDARSLFERLDDSRPALAASGELDVHAYLGWREGTWDEFAEAQPNFVSEFGSPALPSVESPVWKQLQSRWPVRDDEPAWLHAGFDPVRWEEVEVGLPSDYPSLDAYVAATQGYQAWLLRFATEQLRKRKFDPCWGAFVYQLVDPFAGIGFGVLDSARMPKAALQELRHAMAPTRVIIDPVGFQPAIPFGISYNPRSPAGVRLVAVNDDPALFGRARVRWNVYRDRLNSTSFHWLREAARKRSFSGDVEFELPLATDPAVQVTSLSLPLRGEGEYRLVAELFVGGRLVDTATLDFEVGVEAAPAAVRPLPRYISDRLVARGSLQPAGDGFSFEFLNRARPAYLAAIDEIRLDGAVIHDAHVRLDGQGPGSTLPRRLELPLDVPVKLHVVTREPVRDDARRLEIDVRIPGVASGRLVVEADGAGEAKGVEATAARLD